MTTRNPLFYQSSKCVALYMDANIRFQLFLRCPGFCSVHKTQPVRIHELKVRPNNFEVNGTVFSVGIIRKYSATTPTPKPVKVSNAGGGIQYDVDRNLVNKWAMEKSEIGRFYSIGFNKVKEIEEFFSLFINIPGAERGDNEETRWSEFPECIIIPMRDETELNVWFEKTNEEDKVYCNTKYIVKIKVQNSGYAQVHGSF